MNASEKNELIKRITEIEGLSDKERSSLLGLLRENKSYGLVWEDKLEEIYENLKINLPVLREIQSKRIISEDSNVPNHIIIEGDNIEALSALNYTHHGLIDMIYIDPPYNTGNKDFIYNDNYVEKEDSFKHSQWLSFMSKRLSLASQLLSSKGVILISIDDNEQAPLKLLCDQIFKEKNYVCTFIWRGGKRNMSKWISTSHEYMLLYAKDISFCSEYGVEWKEEKKGLNEIYRIVNKFLSETGDNYEIASERLKKWYRSLPDDNPCKDHKHYCWIDSRGVYFASDISRGGGGGPKWPIKNPKTGEFVKIPSRGWAYSSLEALQEDIENDLIHFNGNGVPCKKRYLKDNEKQILDTVFYKDRRASSKRLRSLMGGDYFPFPKDEEILSEKIKSFTTKSSIILDFFAGSGTTLHSTMRLNAIDGGHRQCILVTNNENNICEDVTYERNRRVIQGYTDDKGNVIEGLLHNSLRYYKTELISRNRTIENMRKLVRLSTDMLCIKENLYEELDEFGGQKVIKKVFRYYEKDGRRMLVIYREEWIPELVDIIATLDISTPIKVYVFATSEDPWTGCFEDVSDKVELCALPQAIYNAYKRVLPKMKDEIMGVE